MLAERCAHRTAAAPAILALAACAGPLWARQADPEPDRPRIERLTFQGAAALDERDLGASIATKQTRCHSFLLGPLCALTDWGLLPEEHFLNARVLSTDELRLRVYGLLRSTGIEVGRYISSNLFVVGEVNAGLPSPGVRVEYTTLFGVRWLASWHSQWLSAEPTLTRRDPRRANVLGTFRFREWRF